MSDKLDLEPIDDGPVKLDLEPIEAPGGADVVPSKKGVRTFPGDVQVPVPAAPAPKSDPIGGTAGGAAGVGFFERLAGGAGNLRNMVGLAAKAPARDPSGMPIDGLLEDAGLGLPEEREASATQALDAARATATKEQPVPFAAGSVAGSLTAPAVMSPAVAAGLAGADTAGAGGGAQDIALSSLGAFAAGKLARGAPDAAKRLSSAASTPVVGKVAGKLGEYLSTPSLRSTAALGATSGLRGAADPNASTGDRLTSAIDALGALGGAGYGGWKQSKAKEYGRQEALARADLAPKLERDFRKDYAQQTRAEREMTADLARRSGGGTKAGPDLSDDALRASVEGEIGEMHREVYSRLTLAALEKAQRGEKLTPQDQALLIAISNKREALNPQKTAKISDYLDAERAGNKEAWIAARIAELRAAKEAAARGASTEAPVTPAPAGLTSAEKDAAFQYRTDKAVAEAGDRVRAQLSREGVPESRSLEGQANRDAVTRLADKLPLAGRFVRSAKHVADPENAGLGQFLRARGGAFVDPAAAVHINQSLGGSAAKKAAGAANVVQGLSVDAILRDPAFAEWLRDKRGEGK